MFANVVDAYFGAVKCLPTLKMFANMVSLPPEAEIPQ